MTTTLHAEVKEIIPYLTSIESAPKDLVVTVGNATIDSVQLAKLEEFGLVIESINTHKSERFEDDDGFGIVFGKVIQDWDKRLTCPHCGYEGHVNDGGSTMYEDGSCLVALGCCRKGYWIIEPKEKSNVGPN